MADTLEFGADWYPEQWPEKLWEDDARRMESHGFRCVRIMEFAWSVVEPEPGRFDFSLFDRAIQVLAAHGLKVIIGTPTATPPQWLADRPVFRVSPDGRRHVFGSRRNLCYNAPEYQEAARRVTREIAKHFGGDFRISGFQIDNEIGHEGSDRCVCEHCVAAWHKWLGQKYGKISALNDAWGARFWNTSYARFEQVPAGVSVPSTGLNPNLLLDYDRFCSDSACAFAQEQTRLVRSAAGRGQWITTNLFPPPLSNAIDMEGMTEGMDFASWDNYPVWGDQDAPLPWQFNATAHTYVRGLRDNVPFTIMEEMSGFQGHTCLGHLPSEKQVALWAVQTIARGANRILFFRWRTATLGQEQLCYGLLDADNKETERFRVLTATMRRAEAELSGIAGVRTANPACLVYSKDDARLLQRQYQSKGLLRNVGANGNAGYDLELATWFAPFVTLGTGTDIASARSLKPEAYKVISLPLYQMADAQLVRKLATWVEAGGTLILGYRTGTRDTGNSATGLELPGLFGDLAGITVPRFESLNEGSAKLRIGLIPARGKVWADIIEPGSASPVAFWSDRSKFYRGKPAVTVNTVGLGKVWYIGTSPDPVASLLLYRRILREAGLEPRFTGTAIESVPRVDESGTRYRLVLNHSSRNRRACGAKLGPWDWALVPDRRLERLARKNRAPQTDA